MKRIFYILPAILLMASCGQNNKSTSESSRTTGTDVCASIVGRWQLEHVVVNDSLEVRPEDVDPASKLYAFFYNDSTFNFQTGCNAIGGRYVQTGNSIALSEILCTEMACEDMRVEDLLKAVLPQVNTVDWNDNSTLRLNTPDSAYVVLEKAKIEILKIDEPELKHRETR